MGGILGDDQPTTTTVINKTEPTQAEQDYQKSMGNLADSQVAMSEAQLQVWKDVYQPYEEAKIAQNMRLLEPQTDYQLAYLDSQSQLLGPSTALQLEQVDFARDNLAALAPVRDQFYTQALEGLDPEAEADRALADVNQTFGQQGRQQERQALRLGLNTGSGAFAAMKNQTALAQAAAGAGARNSARLTAQDKNFQRLQSAMTLGGLSA